MPVCAFSKHFQWLDWKDAASLCAEIGYDGVDITVRRDGHVEPERVTGDLPKAVQIFRQAGLEVPMITAGIVDAGSPHAEAIVETAAKLGIRRYRWGGFRYDAAKPVPEQIAEFTARSRNLAELNRRHGVCAMYHTHSGIGQFGASLWDIWLALKDLDHTAVGVNLDIGHATVEGGFGGWINSTRLLLPITRGIAVKDFRWEKNEKGEWRPRWCPMGEGMVNFRAFFRMVKQAGFSGPIQHHMEFPELGAAHTGRNVMTISRAEFVRIAKADLAYLRASIREAESA
jgi:sugar phosphate isomerase/epimerase